MFVYKEYDQDSLDGQFNTRQQVPEYADYLNRWEMLSREAESTLQVIKDIPYGNLPREKLDVFPSSQGQSKTLIFIHGGYWQTFDKVMFHLVAKGFHSYGFTTVLLNYPLAPEASIDQIVLSCRTAITWLYGNSSRFNIDPDQMFVAGHSAGGHLAAMLMATDWKEAGLPVNVLKGACLISGLFNLIPLHLCYVNKVVNMNMETAIRNSPARLEPFIAGPLIVAVGAAESAEFNHQSEELYASWKDKATDIRFLQLPQLNHYSIVESIVEPESTLHKAICKLMKNDSSDRVEIKL